MANTPIKREKLDKDKPDKASKSGASGSKHDGKENANSRPVIGEDDIDFNLIGIDSLKRYKKVFKIKAKTSPKADLIGAISTHFHNDTSLEGEASQKTTWNFAHMVRQRKGKFHGE